MTPRFLFVLLLVCFALATIVGLEVSSRAKKADFVLGMMLASFSLLGFVLTLYML